ncbi:DUF3467 domain-containing protein [candidate division GN15 bacterium]|jgi:hypothetical protein|nr:DUF3467 domain-containing protein [candidate division GN15 bacterium]
MEQRQQQQQLKIEVQDKEAEGIYANLALITHSPTEIILDFARVMPGLPKARVLSRIVMTPMHARLLQKALTDNLAKFESQFGEIKVHGSQNQASNPIGFSAQDTSDRKAE